MIINTARDLAYGINKQFRLNMTPRPWQIYEPDETLWWLVPSTEWPAYRHGKFVFSAAKDSPRKALLGLNDPLIEVGRIFAGLNIEKGYGPLAAEVDSTIRRKSTQIMGKDWLWSTFIEGDGPSRVDKMLKTVAASNLLYLYVVASYVHDRESDAQRERDAVMYSYHPNGLFTVLHNKYPVGVLRGIDKMQYFTDLAELLKKVDDYYWVDIYIGTHVSAGDVDLNKLHKQVLSHLDEWVIEVPK